MTSTYTSLKYSINAATLLWFVGGRNVNCKPNNSRKVMDRVVEIIKSYSKLSTSVGVNV